MKRIAAAGAKQSGVRKIKNHRLRHLRFLAPCCLQNPPCLACFLHPSWLQSFTLAPCTTQTPPYTTWFLHPSCLQSLGLCFLAPLSLSCLTPRTHLAWWPRYECQTARLWTVMSISVYSSSQLLRFSLATRTMSTINLLMRPSSDDLKKKSSSYWSGIARREWIGDHHDKHRPMISKIEICTSLLRDFLLPNMRLLSSSDASRRVYVVQCG
jgi:hypothetical protein